MYLRDDLPTIAEMEEERRTGVHIPREILAIVAQVPQSEISWPYTFQSCHPAKRWRRPDPDELHRAKIFYRLIPASKPYP